MSYTHYANDISIHALREEGDGLFGELLLHQAVFLSTPSARRATTATRPPMWKSLYFYPRPPRGGRPWGVAALALRILFLSTPSARRATAARDVPAFAAIHFYPRPPRGGRPPGCPCCSLCGRISIHALREEGDMLTKPCRTFLGYFYPRPPRGGRPWRGALSGWIQYFYPRPPRGGRRMLSSPPKPSKLISIHALREEGDTQMQSSCWRRRYFYPRPPRGGRP